MQTIIPHASGAAPSRAQRRLVAIGLAVVAALAAGACDDESAGDPARGEPPAPWAPLPKVVDLTHTLSAEFPFIPVPGITFPFKSVPIATVAENGVAANRWEIHEHLGTQIDAPSHFIEGGMTLENVAVADLVVPLAVIDIAARAARDADAEVGVDDVLAWEASHGPLPENAAVFVYSGWEARLGSPGAFLNADAANVLHFPGFSTAAAAFLLAERRVSGIGVDTISIDPGRDGTFATHKAWLAGGKWAVECVANLAKVPPAGATVFVGATKVAAATGGPVRLLALW